MTPDGDVTDFPIPTGDAGARYLTLGPDCSLWFTEFDGNEIGKLSVTFGAGGGGGAGP
jgi:virginiamycin B lyase